MQLIAFIAAIAAIVPTALANLTINTPPNVVECEPTQVTWSGGQAPYYLSVIPNAQVSASPYETFPTQNGTSFTWTVNLPAGLNINFALKDSTGAMAYTSLITIQDGSSNCVSTTIQASATGSSGGSSSGSSGSTAAGSTPQTTPAASATGASSAGSPGSSTTSASGSSSTTTSGAGRLGVSTTLGVAGIMGLVGAALF